MGFPGMITSVPCMSDKVKLKATKRITDIMREKRTRRPCGPSSILCGPEGHWFLPSGKPLPWSLPHRDPLDEHSSADVKLGHSDHNNFSFVLCRILPKLLILACFSAAVINTNWWFE